MSTSAPSDVSPAAPASPALSPAPAGRRSPRLWGRLGIQSKLLAMLLGVSIVSVLSAGFISYRLASDALTQAAMDKLVAVGDARTKQIEATETGLRQATILNSTGLAKEAMTAFAAGFAALDRPVTPADQAAVQKYYETVFVPNLRPHVDGDIEARSFYPRNNAGLYLQAKYTTPFTDFDKAIDYQDAGDGSSWSAAHARYHSFFRNVVLQNGYEDVMLLDPSGNAVYTAYKGADLGVNFVEGAYKNSALAAAVKEVFKTNSVNAFAVVDYEEYAPSYNVPTIFGVSPIGEDGRLTGVLVAQLPIDGINNVMTGNRTWAQSGLGSSGEVFLVGSDRLMRSTSRLLIENPSEYRRQAVDAGTPATLADEIVEESNPILRQKVDSESVSLALAGKSGTITENDYLGRRVITAYFPFNRDGLTWAVLAQIDESEALAPVGNLFRVLAAITLGAVLLVTLLSTLLARAFTRPVTALLTGVRRVAGGDLGSRVPAHGRDEFAQLARAFNDMAASLSTKQELLDTQLAENDRLVGNLMPETVARRYREGESNIVERHQDVTVVYGTIDGLDDIDDETPDRNSATLLNELVRIIDATAARHGLEKVRAMRSGYIAACGLVVPRVDHVLRCLDFAREVQRELVLFNGQHDIALRLRLGMDSGPVTGGLVGSAAIYDMWGESVNLAYQVQADTQTGVFVTNTVYDRARESYRFTAVGSVETKAGPTQIWRLEEDGSA